MSKQFVSMSCVCLMFDVEGLLVFLSIYTVKYGAPSLIEVVDRVQPKLVFCFFPAIFSSFVLLCEAFSHLASVFVGKY